MPELRPRQLAARREARGRVNVKLAPRCLAVLIACATGALADEPAPIGYARVDAVLAALRADPSSKFENQAGWTIVAASESGRAVQWFFTPEGHPAHPAVVKRTVLELNGTSYIDLAALCQVEQSECDQLLADFNQVHELTAARLCSSSRSRSTSASR